MTDPIAWNVEAERSCIGAVLLAPDMADRMDLVGDDFGDRQLGAAWNAILSLRAARRGIDPVNVADAASKAGRVLSLATISDCLMAVPTSDNAEQYATIVRDDALTRRIHAHTRAALSSGLAGEKLLEQIYESLSGLYARRGDTSVLMSDLATERIRSLSDMSNRRQRGESIEVGIPTGLVTVDETLGGGLALGAVTILGGRTTHGKSALGLTITLNATRAGHATHVFSLEDERDAYGDRGLAIAGGLKLHDLRTGRLDRASTPHLLDAAQSLGQRANWRIDDATRLTSAQIGMRVRKHKAHLRTQLVVVDFLQLVSEQGRDPRERINVAMEGLVHLARSENVAVLLLSQLGRSNEKESRPPELYDLKESGNIEEYARAVLLLWRWQEKNGSQRAELRIAKQKHGRAGIRVPLTFNGATVTFCESSQLDGVPL